MKQLDASMQPNELDILRDSRQEVAEFLRLGRKWGFFTLAEKTSEKAGREILSNAYMPESNLATLIKGRDPSSLAAIEKMVDEGLKENQKYLAHLLILRIEDMYKKESKDHGTVALNAGDAEKMLENEQDPANYLRWVNVPAPTHAVPDWFQVIEKNGMGPADLDMIYARMDEENVKLSADGVTEVVSREHDAIMKTSDAE
ncbi:MAG: hypothetical protein O3A80_03090 [bacterium]|nr:hypothetical protein [bacterium]